MDPLPCPEHTRPILFLWSFDDNGNPYLDSRIDINEYKSNHVAARDVQLMALRARYSFGKEALMHIDIDAKVESLEEYIKSARIPALREEILSKLKGAGVKFNSLMRKRSDSNSIEFIHDLVDELTDCTCNTPHNYLI